MKKKYMSLRLWIALPFVSIMIIPALILDIFLEIYHHICFPLYGIPLIKRKNYIKIDRYKLKYLNWIDKIGCTFCGYTNGLVKYAVVIAGKTENFWCAIKHKKYKGFVEQAHQKNFLEYGDEKAFRKKGKRNLSN